MSDTAASQLKQKRLAAHLSIRELSRLSGVAVGTIRRTESGEGEPFEHTIRKLEDAILAATSEGEVA